MVSQHYSEFIAISKVSLAIVCHSEGFVAIPRVSSPFRGFRRHSGGFVAFCSEVAELFTARHRKHLAASVDAPDELASLPKARRNRRFHFDPIEYGMTARNPPSPETARIDKRFQALLITMRLP